MKSSVVDRQLFDADPDRAFCFDTDPVRNLKLYNPQHCSVGSVRLPVCQQKREEEREYMDNVGSV